MQRPPMLYIFANMYTALHCIALRTVRHSDTKNIVSAWSRELGRVAFAFPAGSGREARRRRALTTPLALFEGQCELRPGREIHTIRDLRPLKGSPALDGSPVKGLVALFLAETLDLLLRRAEADSPVSDFLFGSVAVLDSMRRPAALANFHLVFLYRLAAMLGVEPDVSEWEPGMHFDMRDACFRPTAPLHSDFLPPAEAAVVPLLARLGYRGMHLFRANRSERNAAVDHMMRYFSIHLAPLTSLKSLAVLREMGGD